MSKQWTPSRRNVMGGLAAGAASLSFGSRFAAAQTKLPVNIISTQGNATATIQKLVQTGGYLDQFGVSADMIYINDGSKLIGALLSGQSDICMMSGFGPALAAIAKGAKLKIVGGALVTPEHAVYSGKPEIKSISDLKGKTIASGSVGALTYAMTVEILKKYNVDPATVTFVNAGSSPDIFRMVAAGVVDAGISEIDVYNQQAKYHVHSLQGGDLWKELPEFTYQAAYASERAIAEKRDTLVRTLAAYAKLYRYLETPQSQDAYVTAQTAVLGKPNVEASAWQWKFFETTKIYATGLVLDETRISYMQNLNVSMGIQKKTLPYDQITDMSLARDAIKLLGS